MTSPSSNSFGDVFGHGRGATDPAYRQRLDEAAAQALSDQQRQTVLDAFLTGRGADTDELRSLRLEARSRVRNTTIAYAFLVGPKGKLLAYTPEMVGSASLLPGTPVFRRAKLDERLMEALGQPKLKSLTDMANNGILRSALVAAGLYTENALVDKVTLTAQQALYLRKLASIGGRAPIDNRQLHALPLKIQQLEQAWGGLVDRGLLDTESYPVIAINDAGWRVHARYDT